MSVKHSGDRSVELAGNTSVILAAHGKFIAPTEDVANKLALWTRAAMERQIMDLWPTVFTRVELRTFPSYVLAVILSQI